MTKQMYEDYIKAQKRKIRGLIIAVVVMAILLIGMSIVAFSSFEIAYEYTEDEYVDIDQNAEDSDNVTQNADAHKSELQIDKTYIICGTIILCVLITVIGVVIYGKSKSKNNNSTSQNNQSNNS